MNRNWVIAGSLALILTVGVASWTSFRLSEDERRQKLIVPDCSIQKDSVRILFDTNMNVEFALAEECGENLRRAINEGRVGLREAMGNVNINLYFSDAFAGRVVVDQDFQNANYTATVPNDIFWTYANMNEGRAAEDVRVELNYVSNLQESPVEIVSQAIPRSTPKVIVQGDSEDHYFEDDGVYGFSTVFVRYESYQVADAVEFDWPGEEISNPDMPSEQGASPENRARFAEGGWLVSTFPTLSPSGTVVVRVVQDGKTVQSLNIDYKR